MALTAEAQRLVEGIDDNIRGFRAQQADHEKRFDDFEAKLDRLNLTGPTAAPSNARPVIDLPYTNARPALGRIDQAARDSWHAFYSTGDVSELRAGLSVVDDPQGGYLVPEFVSNRIDSISFESSPIRNLARIETIDEGDAFVEPQQRGDLVTRWVGETETRTETAIPTLGEFRVPLHELNAQPRATQKHLDLNSFNAEAWLTGNIGDAFGRAEATTFVAGDGIQKPRGFTDYATAAQDDATRPWGTIEHVVTGVAADLPAADSAKYDLLVDVTATLKVPYRLEAVWLANRTTIGRLMKIKSTDGVPIWNQSMQAGQPSLLLGYPVIEAADMPDIAANTYPIAFANLRRGYIIINHSRGMRILRDPFTAKPHVLFDSYRRVGGDVFNFECIKLVKVST